MRGELDAALTAVADHSRLSARLGRAREAETSASRAVAAARAALADETADVAALESFSPTRIWAALRGSRDTDLDRERAEQQAAEYVVARAEAELAAAQAEVASAEAALAALGDVAARRQRALAAMEDLLRATDPEVGGQLQRLSGEVAAATAQRTEVAEAAGAAAEAARLLGVAQQSLGSAGGWATYDTFFGGGLMTDMMKYDRMDATQQALHQADGALRRLARELADVGLRSTVDGLQVDGLTRTFDVWFDNIFSDWAVKSRISEAAERTDRAARLVHEVRVRLAEEERAVAATLARLTAERERLLGA